jgi:hypothetical protein
MFIILQQGGEGASLWYLVTVEWAWGVGERVRTGFVYTHREVRQRG